MEVLETEVDEGQFEMSLDILGTTYFRIEDVADMLKLSTRKVGDMLRDGEIPARKIGGAWHVSKGNLKKWLESAENQEEDDEYEDDEYEDDDDE